MQKSLFLIFFVFICLFYSCKAKTSLIFDGENNNTLATIFAEKESLVEWTQSIEKDLLSKNIRNVEGIHENVPLSVGAFALSSKSRNNIVYPYLQGFGSLNISQIESKPFSVLSDFAESICSKSSADSFFEPSNKNALVFFLYDVKEILGEEYSFKDYILGEPFINDDIYQVPIRFNFSGGFFDIFVYLNQRNSYKISQIQVWQYLRK